MRDLLRLDLLGKQFVPMCAALFPFRKAGGLQFLCCEKIHSVLHTSAEIMRWGNVINSSAEAAEESHKINVKGPCLNLNHCYTDGYTLLAHARRKETVGVLGSAIQGIIV